MRGYKVVAPMNWAAGRGVRQDKTPPNSGVGRLDEEPGSPTPVGLPGVFLAACQERKNPARRGAERGEESVLGQSEFSAASMAVLVSATASRYPSEQSISPS